MIRSFACDRTRRLFERQRVKALPPEIHRTALRKLRMLHRATSLRDLTSPPANRLESLKGERRGQYSIRINQQYRICFHWVDGDAFEVEVVDYH